MEELKQPPAPADPEEVASIARQGILGQCLQEALNEIVAEDAIAAQDNKEEDPTPKLYLKQHMGDNVAKEFGHAVAQTKWTCTKKEPPAALIRGRLDHYNRFHGKWRIIVREAQFKRRPTLEKNRRNRNPPPLWGALPATGTTGIVSFQILAFDDL